MKVILLQDIPKIGKKYDIKNISDGYVCNFLLPKGMVRVATANAEVQISKYRARMADESDMNTELLKKNIATLSGGTVTIKEKANEKGSLFAGVGVDRIVNAVKSELKLDIPKEAVELSEPIKSVGEHDVEVKAHNFQARFTLKVVDAR